MEFWTNLGDAAISGNSTLLKIMTARINAAFDRIMPLVLSYCDHLRWDDTNHTDKPIATFALTSGQADYKFTTDDNSLNVLNITAVRILPSATATDYVDLERLTLDDPIASEVMSPNSTNSGTPSYFLEHGNNLYLYPEPNFTASAGIKVFFERDPSYFVSSDTTKKPGIPRPFHSLLALYPAYDWLLVNKPDNGTLISRLEAQIARREKELATLISTKNPTRTVMTMGRIRHR